MVTAQRTWRLVGPREGERSRRGLGIRLFFLSLFKFYFQIIEDLMQF